MKVIPNYSAGTYGVWDDNENYPADMSVDEMDRIAAAMQLAVNAMSPPVETKDIQY